MRQKIRVSNRELCDAVERATLSLRPGKFVRDDGTTFDKHCSVCAVGGIFREIPRLNKIITKKAAKIVQDQNDRWNRSKLVNLSDISSAIGENFVGYAAFDSSYDSKFYSADEMIEHELEKGNYLAAISVFFESVLEKNDDKMLKASALQTFIISHIPSTIEIEV